MNLGGVTFDQIVEYLMGIIKVILSLFKIEVDDETADNIGSIFDGLLDYVPETK